MTTLDLIHAEVNRIDGQYLDELYDLVKKFAASKEQNHRESLMSKLKQVKIEGPEDFAANHDLYVTGATGEKPDLR